MSDAPLSNATRRTEPSLSAPRLESLSSTAPRVSASGASWTKSWSTTP